MRFAFFLGILFCVSMVLAVQITEVLYDPIGDETSQEFVEVYSPTNLTNYVFGDKSRNQSLQLVQWTDNPYALIVTTLYNRSGQNLTFYTTGSQLGNGLANTGDAVFLYFNGTLLDSMSYNASAAPEGYSLERTEQGWEASINLNGTPGSLRSPSKTILPSLVQESFEVNVTPSLTLVSFPNSPNRSMTFSTDKLIYRPGETMRLALEWSFSGEKARVEIRDLQGNLLKQYPSVSKSLTYKITKNTSAILIHAQRIAGGKISNEDNLSDEKVVGVLLPLPLISPKFFSVKNSSCSPPSKELVRIVSFYTRAQKYQEKIKLYFHLEGEGNYTLLLDSSLETMYRNITLNKTYEDFFEVKPGLHKNLFTLQAFNMNQTYAPKILVFYLESPNLTQTYSANVSLTEKPLVSNVSLKITSVQRIEPPPIIPQYTGTLAYDSRVPSYLTYGLVVLLIVTLFALFRKGKVETADLSSEQGGTK
ncbi:MAG: lamin tail domain-containing protein [Nanoarchaeota archaeon]